MDYIDKEPQDQVWEAVIYVGKKAFKGDGGMKIDTGDELPG